MTLITIRAKGQVTIPEEVRRSARIVEGDLFEVEITEDGLLLRPKRVIDGTQAWFWDAAWQAGEHEADEDLRAGRTTQFSSAEEMINELQGLATP